MKEFKRPEHRIIAKALGLMDREFLTANQCWFGGGTAIVMKLGEYRRSLDVDFLCADADGYRELRTRATERGVRRSSQNLSRPCGIYRSISMV
jgi:hypothetical protein